MTKHRFLSDEWMEEAKRIREQYHGKGTPLGHVVRMNLVVTEVPFGEGEHTTIEAHMDSTSGEMEMELGHLDGPDVTLTADYATVKAVFVDGNPQAGMQAFMSGKIKVQGDMTKLMAMQSSGPDPVRLEAMEKIREMTADD